MKIYNSLTKEKEELKPIVGNKINMYSCGVTVYDKCHIGHARSLYIFDVIRRHLKNSGFDVTFVRNITDVDDKIINKANQLGREFEDVVEENIAFYENDLELLKVDKADIEPRATQNIEGMIEHIQSLIDKGFAYESDGDVYFKVREFKDYGKLSGQSIDKMLEGVRIEADSKKKDPLDFVLWKRSKEGEPSWSSPWGEGRPGWHIECSVMSMKELGCETLDIHAGGRDLVFPHHENEIAQSEALTGKPFAKYWIHHGLLKIDGQKMAKSLGNFLTVDQILEKFSSNVLKLFFLQSHYSSEINFSWEKMEEIERSFDRIVNSYVLLETIRELGHKFSKEKKNELEEKSYDEKKSELLDKYYKFFVDRLDDDFNTPRALSVLFDFVKMINASSDGFAYGEASATLEVLKMMAEDSLGLSFEEKSEEISSEKEEELLQARIEARANKDYQRSDELRDKLHDVGIIVEDGKDGQTWRRA